MRNIEERLRSRFEAGLVADIEPPDLETKIAIIYKKGEEHNKQVPANVASFIANNIKTNIRELEGLLLRVIAYASFTHRPIDLPLTQEVLREFVYDKNKNFNIATIMAATAVVAGTLKSFADCENEDTGNAAAATPSRITPDKSASVQKKSTEI